MRAVTALAVLLVMACAGLPRADEGDEAAIRALVARYVEAREARDRAVLEALFTDDADQLVSTGEWRRGRAALVPGALASSERTAGVRRIEVDTVRVIAPGVAIADGVYTIAGSGRPPMRATIVAVRRDGEWRITAIRNMLPAPPIDGR